MNTLDVDKPAREPGTAAFGKRSGGLRRLLPALGHSVRGLAAAWRHEAAFRQEVVVGVPLITLAPWLAAEPWQAALMVGSILLVWIAELLNSAVEALCDAVTCEMHPLIGRAKDLGSAAVFVAIVLAIVIWASVL